ncbi:PREDICTED: uncharacterized protein LOC102007627 isoform X2 [Chinchilla lanigera]|uniref:uncharacterized protein LOC102007627 isoform X2 n=1 Tax=Chinchilla lanigera TaxID=34839 RepID=UPI000698C691|nr:PREDICTED: uncharacterized protein LOC102007627 isoform X2 [Chinchilla lanigera]
MWSRRRTDSLGSGHETGWSGALVQMWTRRASCLPRRPGHTEARTQKVTRKSPGQGTRESAPWLEEARRAGSLEPGTLKKLVNQLVPAHRRGDPFFVPAFLSTYRRFATTRQVLDLLFLRYRFFHPDSEEDQQNKSCLQSCSTAQDTPTYKKGSSGTALPCSPVEGTSRFCGFPSHVWRG